MICTLDLEEKLNMIHFFQFSPAQVEIDCVTSDGIPCEDLPPTDGTCAVGEPFTQLEFSYINCDCEESNNSQEDDGTYTCTDSSDVCNAAESVLVQCFDGTLSLIHI